MTKMFHMIPCSTVFISCLFFATHACAEETTPNIASEINGKAHFDTICSHCHNITYDESRIGAPGLKGVLERHDEEWLNHWIKSPESFAKVDGKAKDLISSNKFGLAMPTIPAMQDDQARADIIAYLKTLK